MDQQIDSDLREVDDIEAVVKPLTAQGLARQCP